MSIPKAVAEIITPLNILLGGCFGFTKRLKAVKLKHINPRKLFHKTNKERN
jgi:hypothetical protein